MAGGGYDLEEIRRRADIVEIISPHVALRKAGRRLVGLCPFHQERTGSFTVDPETGLWHCFGCKAGGDLFRFVEMIEKVTFAEAVEMLARRFGVAPRRPAQAARQRDRERLLALHAAACEFYRAQLRAPAGRQAAAYLQRRGLSMECIESFSIGYAPGSWDGLLAAMARGGYSGQELARGGLAVPREDGGFYDRFRDRVMFPIWDSTGRVIAFGGRALGDDQSAKYINSPDSPLFQKGHTLYAFDRARRAMGEAGQAIVVEGYLDAIACHEAGFAETVATMGTALTPDHVELLRRRASRLVLAFDADSAGLAAALRGRDLFQQAGLAVRVVTLPDAFDPDRVVREQGAEAFRKLVSTAVPMIEWELSRILRRLPVSGDSPAGEPIAIEAMQEAVAALARLPAGVEREYYIRWLAGKGGGGSPSHLAKMEAAVREELAGTLARRGESGRRTGYTQSSGESVNKQAPGRPSGSRMQADLLAALIRHGELAVGYGPKLEPDDFGGGQRSILLVIRRLVEAGQPVTAQAVLAQLDPEAREELAELLLREGIEERVEESVAGAVARVIEARLSRQESALRQRLEEVESEQEREAILRELTESRRQRSQLAGQRLIGEE